MVFYCLFGVFLSQQTTIFKFPSIERLTGSLRVSYVCNDWPYVITLVLVKGQYAGTIIFSYRILAKFKQHFLAYLQVLSEESPPLFYGEDSVPARHRESHTLTVSFTQIAKLLRGNTVKSSHSEFPATGSVLVLAHQFLSCRID